MNDVYEIARTQQPVAFDTETDGFRWHQGDSAGVVSFAWGEKEWATRNVPLAVSLLQARMIAGLPCIAHNAPFDIHFLEKAGLQANWDCVHDTLLLARLYNNLADNKLKPLGKALLGIEPAKQDAVKKWLRENKKEFTKRHGREPHYLDVPDDILLPYASEDTVLTLRLYNLLMPLVNPYLYERERKLQRIMYASEAWGVEVDTAATERKLAWSEQEREQLEARLDAYRPGVNLDSNPQLVEWLYSDLGLTPVSFTEKGQPQVNAFNLSANPHPITKLLIARNKRVDTSKFFKAYLDLMDSSGRIHPTINTMQARTHRFSCQNPNMQQIPSRNDRFKTREVFVSGLGYFVGADYDKQEVYISACEANDTRLMYELSSGVDVYVSMAQAMLNKTSISGSERQAAKVAVLSMLYGAGAPKVAESFTINTGKLYTTAQAKVIRDNFKREYVGLAQLMRDAQDMARQQGYVQNKWGRKLYVEPDRAYVATDYLVQSSGRDALADAIINLSEILPKYGGQIVIPIHDEIISYLPEEPHGDILREYEEAMANYRFQVALKAKAKSGKKFSEIK